MPLLENVKNEPVSRLALREPAVVTPEATIQDAVEAMRAKQLGCAIVVDEDHKPIGMFTEAMLTHLLANQTPILDDPVQNHMSSKWPWVSLTDPIADVLAALEFKNVRFVCVVNQEGRLVGLTGQKGLMEYVAEHFPQVSVQRIGGSVAPREREGA